MFWTKKKEHILVEISGNNPKETFDPKEYPEVKMEYLRLRKEVLKVKGTECLSHSAFYKFPMVLFASWSEEEILARMEEIKKIKGVLDTKVRILVPILRT
jgi:hypothetical protein